MSVLLGVNCCKHQTQTPHTACSPVSLHPKLYVPLGLTALFSSENQPGNLPCLHTSYIAVQDVCCFYSRNASPARRRPTSRVSVADTLLFLWLQNYEDAFQTLWVLQHCWDTRYWRAMVQPQGKSKAGQIAWKKENYRLHFQRMTVSSSLFLILRFDVNIWCPVISPDKSCPEKNQSCSLLPY